MNWSMALTAWKFIVTLRGRVKTFLLVDDLLATGGTAQAAVSLLEQTGASVIGCGFIVELGFLSGASRLDGRDVFSLLRYD